ncbi:MAG: DUF3526 domain-containing protein [Gemmatimonadota bacterium]
MVARTVLRNEARLLMADRVQVAALALFGLLFVYAVVNGVAWVSKQNATIEAVSVADVERSTALASELQRIEDGGDPGSPFRDPRSPNVLGGNRGARTVAMKPGPLAALSVGQSDLLPFYYDVSIYTNEQTFLQNGEVANPLNLMVGRFDLAFVIIYLLPLLVLALGHNVLSGEREQGTLALTLSQPVSVRDVVASKLLFRGVLVLGLTLGVSLLGAALSSGFADPARLGLWCLGVTVYALFWFGLAAWVNTLNRSSAWNATALAGAWIALVVVIPALVNIGAGILHPLPSRVEMISTAREASRQAVNERSELLARYLEDHPEMAGAVVTDAASSAALAWAATEEVNRQLEDVATRYDERLAAQLAVVQTYRFFSPALLMQSVLNDAAGTGGARYDRFEGQVRAFAEEWRQYFVPAILAGETMSVASAAGRPEFAFVEEAPGAVFDRAAMPLLVLLLLAVASSGQAAMRLGRVRSG